MHIGLVCNVDVDYGLDMANAFDEAGMSVTLYLSRTQATRAVNCPDRPLERVYGLGLLPSTCCLRLFVLPRMRNPRSLAAVRQLGESIHHDNVDVVHILMGPGEFWLGVLACLLRDIPVVSTMITPIPHVGDDPSGVVVYAGYRLLANASDRVIVNGMSQVELVRRIYRIPANRVIHVPIGVRTTALKWSNGKNPEEPGRVLFSGAARPHKGLEYLVRAQRDISSRVPEARIVIASYGKDLDRCLRIMEDPTHFEIHNGFAPGDFMAALFQKTCVVALPYLSAASSGILMTAYVFGKPVVATRIDGLAEYVKDGITGLLVSPADTRDLANAIVRLLSDVALRQQMSKNIAGWSDELQKRVVVQMLEVYENAISLHEGGTRKSLDRKETMP